MSSLTADEIAQYRSHVGRTEIRTQVLDTETLRRFAAAIGANLDVERAAPPLGHWAYFLDCLSSANLGIDGHPKKGVGILPAVNLPRRMFAASRVTFKAPLQLNREAELVLKVAGVQHKAGKSGDLILIDLDRTLTQGRRTKIVERQTLVYASKQMSNLTLPVAGHPAPSNRPNWVPSSVELLRFSAATFNAHRIHYDLPYAQTEEGYPGLVVHGPLTAAKLYAYAMAHNGAPASHDTFAFRALAPLYAGQAVSFEMTDGEGGVAAIRCDGLPAMSAAWLSHS